MRDVAVPDDFDWDALDRTEVGPLAVALVRRGLEEHGFTVRQPEDRRSTLLARRGAREIELHVRGAKGRSGAPFWTKKSFVPQEELYAAVVILDAGRRPALYLIPSLAWLRPDRLLRDLRNAGGKTPPEWRLNFSPRNDELLAEHAFAKAAAALGISRAA